MPRGHISRRRRGRRVTRSPHGSKIAPGGYRVQVGTASIDLRSALLRTRSLGNLILGRPRGPEVSIQKLFAEEHGQRVMALARDIAGTAGMLVGAGPEGELTGRSRSAPMHKPPISDQFPNVEKIWEFGWRFAPALTIGGGAAEIQRNIVAERTLGLPTEPVTT